MTFKYRKLYVKLVAPIYFEQIKLSAKIETPVTTAVLNENNNGWFVN